MRRRILFPILLLLGTATLASAQTPTVLPVNQPLSLAWDSAGSIPPEQAYKVRLLTQATPTSVAITEIVTPTAATTFAVPYATLPNVPFWVSVRALHTTTTPVTESADSNVIGSFSKPTLKAPAGLRRVP